MALEIDPRIAIYVKISLTVLNLVANGSISLAGAVSPQTATAIVAVCQILITLLGALMTAYSSSAPGPLAPADPKVVQAATKLADLPPGSMPRTVTEAKNAVMAAVNDHVA